MWDLQSMESGLSSREAGAGILLLSKGESELDSVSELGGECGVGWGGVMDVAKRLSGKESHSIAWRIICIGN